MILPVHLAIALLAALSLAACVSVEKTESRAFASPPLITHRYSADPAVHVWDGVIYIYNSHDIENNQPHDAEGSHFVMRDYPVYSMQAVPGEVTDHGPALRLEDIPWAHRQLWAPDTARRGGRYYLYFPAKDAAGVFRIGVASSDSPTGPFHAEPTPIEGAYSVDPAVFEDKGDHYLIWGGIGGGQLQRWHNGVYNGENHYPADHEPALTPRIARLADNMTSLAEAPRPLVIVDKQGKPLRAGDRHRRFAEGAWLHKYRDIYYLSYSTGDTHKIVYATADNPYGPFTWQGTVLEPVLGWTTHGAIVEFSGQWYLFYHDTELSGGQTHLRNIKMLPLDYDSEGQIETLNPFAP